MDQKQFASLGGKARAKKLSQKRIQRIAQLGGIAAAKKRRNGSPKSKKEKQ